MKERIYSEEEVETVLCNSSQLSTGYTLPKLYSLAAEWGFPECQEMFDIVENEGWRAVNNMSEPQRTRANNMMFLMMVSGNVKNNPSDWTCPKCGSKYVAQIIYGDLFPVELKDVKKHRTQTYAESKQRLSYLGDGRISDSETHRCLCCLEKFELIEKR